MLNQYLEVVMSAMTPLCTLLPPAVKGYHVHLIPTEQKYPVQCAQNETENIVEKHNYLVVGSAVELFFTLHIGSRYAPLFVPHFLKSMPKIVT
jgi:hypothetical protein